MLIAGTDRSIEAAVLAGGKNRRFGGKVKANMKVGEKAIIDQSLDILDSVFPRTIIITNYRSEFQSLQEYDMFEDIYKDIGPLGGIHTALSNTSADALFIVAGDMPQLSAFYIRQMAEYFFMSECDVLIPRAGDNIEPLHSVYSRNILGRLEAYISSSEKYAIRDFLKEVEVEYLDITEEGEGRRVFININSQKDLDNYLLEQKEGKQKL